MSLDNVTIGDKLVVTTDYGQRLEVVERITSTLVITKGSRFNKSSGRSTGGSCWHHIYATPATENDIERITKAQHRRELIYRCRNIKFDNLSASCLEQILEIAKGGTQ